jgi:hypothetical protein
VVVVGQDHQAVAVVLVVVHQVQLATQLLQLRQPTQVAVVVVLATTSVQVN